MSRVETGPVRFGDDWAGVFIRGDDAFGFAIALGAIIDKMPSLDFAESLNLAHAARLRDMLFGCVEPCEARQLPTPEDET